MHAVFAASLAAQCALQPIPSGSGVPSLDRQAHCSVRWDPDGGGPAPELLVVSGQFTLAGNLVAPGIAAFDPTTHQWSPLGLVNGGANEFAVLPAGTLLARTLFELHQWNGAAWVPFGAPLPSGQTTAFAAAPNGDVLLATKVGNTASVHRFAGGTWQAIGSATSPSTPEIRTLAVAPNGVVVAGGSFTAMNGIAAAGIASWDGAAWSSFGSGVVGIVQALAFANNGDLVAGGLFSAAGGVAAANVASWNGTNWSPLGAGTSSSFPPAAAVRALLVPPNGDVIAGGDFSVAGGIPASRVARWDGLTWSSMGAGIDPTPLVGEASAVRTLTGVAGEVFAVGNFVGAGGRDALGLARWNGTAWGPMRGSGIGNVVTAVHVAGGGDVFVGGSFHDIDGVVCNGIARRAGNTWQPLGTGLGTPAWYVGVNAIATHGNGDLVVGGDFTTAGGGASPAIARWNGTNWSALGTGLAPFPGTSPSVGAMCAAGNGDLWVAGAFVSAGGVAAEGIARWDGTAWSTLPPGLLGPAFLEAVAEMPNGDVVVAGGFGLGGPGQVKLARWDGASWQLLGVFDNAVRALLPLPGGDLLVGGTFSQIFGVQPFPGLARWSNGSWSSVGGIGAPAAGSLVEQFARLPGGDVIVAGASMLGGQYVGLVRWDGTNWTGLAGAPAWVPDTAVDARGELLIAGHFTSLGSTASAYFARFATPCPATAVAAGTGCVGSGGPNGLATSSLPWLGTTFVSTATGMPGNGLALAVFGFGTASVPLAAILPQGAIGCTLLATPDLVTAHVTTGNSLSVTLPLPLVLPLSGVVLHQQVVPLELGTGAAITAVTATNRLTLVLGAF